jgi:hypothetical protein
MASTILLFKVISILLIIIDTRQLAELGIEEATGTKIEPPPSTQH